MKIGTLDLKEKQVRTYINEIQNKFVLDHQPLRVSKCENEADRTDPIVFPIPLSNNN